MAMLKIARLRYKIFRAKFGRDPPPDDPLFFDSTSDPPIIAGIAEMCAQLMDAALATRSDYTTVMKFLGLDETSPMTHGDSAAWYWQQ